MATIGKNVIENLTTAMYENPYTVYREYIQNAADSIDKAVEEGLITKDEANIDISIEYTKRRITIHDNARGVSSEKFVKILTDIADSEKDPTKDKGFRGIGRLAGVGYCDMLIFKSSAYDEEVESVLKWDGRRLRDVLADTSLHPSASEFVDEITYVENHKAEKLDHYFEVVMENVIPESDDLLDESNVIKYLEAVAPVPFKNVFIYRSEIEKFCNENNLSIDEYNIQVNGNTLYKQYGTKIYDGTTDSKRVVDEIIDVEFRQFNSKDGRMLAWMWFGISNFAQQIKPMNEMRGIRLRKENIQIGDENTLGESPKFFKEPRGNCYFIGEVYAVDNELIPNARRDYFKINATTREFEAELHQVLYHEMYNMYHYANKVKKAFQAETEYQKKMKQFEEKQNETGFINDEDQKKAQSELESAKKKADVGKKTLELRKKDADNDSTLNRIYNGLKNSYYSPEKKDDKTKKKSTEKVDISAGNKYLTQGLSKYSKKEQKLVSKIYAIIKSILPKEMAEMVIKKIQEELSS